MSSELGLPQKSFAIKKHKRLKWVPFFELLCFFVAII